jgi:hypothetical protein
VVTPCSGKEASSNIAVHSAKEGTKRGKKRCKQCPQGVTTMTDYDDGSSGKAGGSNMGNVMTVTPQNFKFCNVTKTH